MSLTSLDNLAQRLLLTDFATSITYTKKLIDTHPEFVSLLHYVFKTDYNKSINGFMITPMQNDVPLMSLYTDSETLFIRIQHKSKTFAIQCSKGNIDKVMVRLDGLTRGQELPLQNLLYRCLKQQKNVFNALEVLLYCKETTRALSNAVVNICPILETLEQVDCVDDPGHKCDVIDFLTATTLTTHPDYLPTKGNKRK